MRRNHLPYALAQWLEDRCFVWQDTTNPRCLTEDEIYSAACEALSDCLDGDNLNCEFFTASQKAALKRFVEREGKTHNYLDLFVWYEKGA